MPLFIVIASVFALICTAGLALPLVILADRRSGVPATSPTAGPAGNRDTAKSTVHAGGGEAAMTDDDSELSRL